MNPSIMLGICAGALLYGVLKALIGVWKGPSLPGCAAQVLSAGDTNGNTVLVHAEPALTLSKVRGMDDAVDVFHELPQEGSEDDGKIEPPSEGTTHESPPSVALPEIKKKQWFVVKSHTGTMKVCQAWKKTPKAIAGPFATKDEAYQAKQSQSEN